MTLTCNRYHGDTSARYPILSILRKCCYHRNNPSFANSASNPYPSSTNRR